MCSGFATLPEHNLALLARQEELLRCGLPLLVGWSRVVKLSGAVID